MILNVLVFLVIVMVTLYLATQGMVSAMIALATATFSSILAMALTEPLEGILSFRPDAARGFTFLLLFLLIFSGTRIIGDTVVKKNIKLNIWVNRGMGAFFGFFTALVVVGSVVIGLELLPVQRTVLGFDRFPSSNVMSSVDLDGKPVLGEATSKRAGVWFSPDGFVLALWNSTSGRSLGGADGKSWSETHPDFNAEAYGRRYPVFAGSVRTAPADLVKVLDILSSVEPKDYQQGRGIPAQAGKRVVVVRVEIQKGDKAPHATFDADGYFRVTAAQVRLVTDKDHQFFPIGDMIQGRTFEPLPLDSGFVVDDYLTKGNAIEEWVFAIPDTENPKLFEIKGARNNDIAALLKDKLPPLKLAEYPPRAYYKDLCTLTVTFDPIKAKVVGGRVYVLKPDANMRDIFPLLKPAYQNVLAIQHNMDSGTNGWSNPPKPGQPSMAAISIAQRYGVNHNGDPDDANVRWREILPVVLMGQATIDPKQNLVAIPTFMKEDVERSWNAVRTGSIISAEADANNADGGVWKATVSRISPAPHPVVITLETDTSFYVWYKEPEFVPPPDAKQPKRDFAYTVTADPQSPDAIFHIEVP